MRHPHDHPPDHPDAEILERFLRNELDRAGSRRIVRHLIAGCPQCVAVTRRFWGLGETPPGAPLGLAGEPDHPGVVDRLAGTGRRQDRRVAREREQAPRLLARILAQPRPKRLGLICGDDAFQNLVVCELLVEKSREDAQQDPLLGVETAELAVAAAARLGAKLWGATLTRTLRARSWAYLGNARRLAGDAAGAERSLAVAWTLLGTIAADPLDRAELLCLEASLAQDARKPEQAGHLLDEALAIYRESGERRLLGQALIQKGMLLGTLGRQEAALRAVDLLREGLARIEERIQPGLAAETLHRLAGLLQEAGSDEQALQAVDRARDLYEALGDRPNLLRLRRLEGRVEESRGNLEAAEAVYREVWEAFLAMDLGREAGISLVHLALLHARQGRTQEVFRLSQELSPILRAQDVRQSHDSLAALLAFRRLAEGGSAAPELLVEVQHCLAGPRAPAGSAPIARIETPTPYAMAFLLSPAGSRDDRLAARVPRAGPAGID